MAHDKIFQFCPLCGGKGTIKEPSGDGSPGSGQTKDIICPTCLGDKYMEWGELRKT